MAIITISRGTFSGGMILADCLSKTLGYRLLSREELLAGAAREYEATEEQLESALTHSPGFLVGGRLRKLHYVYCVQAAMAKEARADNLVYHGYAGHLLLQGIPHHLRLKVVADMEYRIRAAMERGNMSREEAVKRIAELDRDRDRWVQWVYQTDRNDPTTYDLIINLERIPVASACEIAAGAVERNFQTTRESQAAVDDLVCANSIQARIALDRSIKCDRIEVTMEKGVVTISGTVATLQDADNVRILINDTPGVTGIVSKLVTRWH